MDTEQTLLCLTRKGDAVTAEMSPDESIVACGLAAAMGGADGESLMRACASALAMALAAFSDKDATAIWSGLDALCREIRKNKESNR